MDKIAKVKKNLQLQQWAQMVTERQSAGMSVAQWCEHEKISKSVYYYRLRKVREREYMRTDRCVGCRNPRISKRECDDDLLR